MKQIKKAFSLLLAVLLLMAPSLSGVSASAAGEESQLVIGAPKMVADGSTFEVTISITGTIGARGMNGGGILVQYDQECLRFDGATMIKEVNDNPIASDYGTATPGEVMLGLVMNNEAYPYADMQVATLRFTALKTGSTEITAETSEWGDVSIQPAETSATLTVVSESQLGYLGDADGDGHVLAKDARLILRYVAGMENLNPSYQELADVDGKNGITAADARWVLRMAAGLEKLFRYGETFTPAEEQTTKPPAEPTTTAPITKPSVQTSDYDRLVQYLKTNGTYDDGEYVLEKSYTYKDMKVITRIIYDVENARVEFYSHGFYSDGYSSAVALFFDENSSLQDIVMLYRTPGGSKYFGNGYISMKAYSTANTKVNWTRMDCPSSLTTNLQDLAESQLSVLFIDADTILASTGTGITMHSLGFTAY